MKKNNSKPIVALDTNVFLVSLAPQSPYAIIFDALIDGLFTLAISTEILAEYEEKIAERYAKDVVTDIFELLLNLPNIIRQDIYFNWLLIKADPDDDKFVDISVAVGADYLVSDDKHFNVLKHIDFPKINLIKAKDFILLSQNSFQV